MSVKLGNIDIAGTQVLYSTTGNNTDGAMTQAATTTELNNKADIIVVNGKANDSDVVHLTGDETIAGEKSFTVNPWVLNALPNLRIKNTTMDRTVSSVTSNQYANLDFVDKNNQSVANIYTAYYTSGSRAVKMAVFTDTGGSSDISILWNPSGGFWTYAPASDVNNSIVTTVNKNKAANGYFRLGNGLIIQWGHVAAASGDTKTVTFSTAFSNTNYYVHSNINRSGSTGSGWGYVTSKTTTNCKLTTSSDACDWLAIGY